MLIFQKVIVRKNICIKGRKEYEWMKLLPINSYYQEMTFILPRNDIRIMDRLSLKH